MFSKELEAKFWSNIKEVDNGFKIDDKTSLCWIWQGYIDKKGYGWTRDYTLVYKNVKASRRAYELKFGTIKNNVCHKCDIRSCINPDHLFDGTYSDNMKDCVAKGRHKETRKTHCKSGHEYTVENTIIKRRNGKSKRVCRICRDECNHRRIYIGNGTYVTPKKV